MMRISAQVKRCNSAFLKCMLFYAIYTMGSFVIPWNLSENVTFFSFQDNGRFLCLACIQKLAAYLLGTCSKAPSRVLKFSTLFLIVTTFISTLTHLTFCREAPEGSQDRFLIKDLRGRWKKQGLILKVRGIILNYLLILFERQKDTMGER